MEGGPPNAFSRMMKRRIVKRPAELAAAAEDDASATLSRTLEVHGLPSVDLQRGRFNRKPKVLEEELTHVQKMRRRLNETMSDKRREDGLWDPNVYGGGILQVGSAIRTYTIGHISQHKGPYGKCIGVADLQWLVEMLDALLDTDGYPCCNLSGIRFTWNSEGYHGEKNVEVIVARCNSVERESYGAVDLRTSFTNMFKQMLPEFNEPTLELAAERHNDEEDVIARVEEVFGANLEGHKRIFDNINKAADHDARRNGWTDAHRKAFKGLFGGHNGLLCTETKKMIIQQCGRCAYTGILMNGCITSPFCVSLERLNNEICHFPLKLDELGQPCVDFSNVVWIVRLIQVRNGWSHRIALTALLSSPTLERSREQENLIKDALSAAPLITKRQKGGAKNLNQAAARQVRENAGVSKYAPLEREAVVVNLDNVHNEVEADITSKQRMAKMRANRKRAALPLGTSAFSMKLNGEPRKNKRAAVVAKSMRTGGDDEDGEGDKEEEGR
ncbi:hypothetical protein T492DRAFT_878966 [Pavlovales sp. CCMP2436]|nr:hypothetical protein T492DRAFT_878966 [Pavlovales sp. CCMP2436]